MKKKVLSMVMSLALACSSFGCITAFADNEKEASRVHFSNDYGWENVYVYSWYSGEFNEEFGAWPGVAVLEDSSNEGWYTVDIKADNFIFNNVSEQTGNLANQGKEMWVYADNTIVTEAPEGWTEGSEPNLGETVSAAYEYYVVGEEGLTGVNWGDGFANGNYGIELVKDEDGVFNTASKAGIAAGSYEFKVVQDPANYGWTFNWGAMEGEEVKNFKVDVAEDNSTVEFAFMNYAEGAEEEDCEDTLLDELEESYDEDLDFGEYDSDYELGGDFAFDEDFELSEDFDYSELFTDEELTGILGADFTDEEVAELIAKIGFIVDFFSDFEEMGTHTEYDGDAYLLVSVYSATEVDKIGKLNQLIDLLLSKNLEDFTMETLDEILELLGYVEVVAPVVPEVSVPEDVQNAIQQTTTTTESANKNDESPKTGDSPIVPIAVVTGVIALAVVVVLSVKKAKA